MEFPGIHSIFSVAYLSMFEVVAFNQFNLYNFCLLVNPPSYFSLRDGSFVFFSSSVMVHILKHILYVFFFFLMGIYIFAIVVVTNDHNLVA